MRSERRLRAALRRLRALTAMLAAPATCPHLSRDENGKCTMEGCNYGS